MTMGTVTDLIQSVSIIAIVLFLFYFFIYYRKPMKSVLEALGDADLFKAGPLEYKRRQQQRLNQFLKEPEDVSITKDDSEEIEQINIKRKLLKMSVFALISGVQVPGIINKVGLREIKEVYNKVYNDLSMFDSESDFLKESSEIVIEFVPNFNSL